jgi:hypothetical protein
MQGNVKVDYLVGNGAAQNVEIGFIPDYVRIVNVTDGDIDTEAFLGLFQTVPFTSGGVTEITAGQVITGATSGATARVIQILPYSGSWAAGDIAGFFVVDMLSGTFTSENVNVGSSSNLATVTANVNHNVATAAAVAGATGNAAISRYVGAAGSNARGFTVGSTIAEEAKLLRYVAIRGDY